MVFFIIAVIVIILIVVCVKNANTQEKPRITSTPTMSEQAREEKQAEYKKTFENNLHMKRFVSDVSKSCFSLLEVKHGMRENRHELLVCVDPRKVWSDYYHDSITLDFRQVDLEYVTDQVMFDVMVNTIAEEIKRTLYKMGEEKSLQFSAHFEILDIGSQYKHVVSDYQLKNIDYLSAVMQKNIKFTFFFRYETHSW